MLEVTDIFLLDHPWRSALVIYRESAVIAFSCRT